MRGRLEVVDDVAAAFVSRVTEAFTSRQSERFSMLCSGGPTAARCYEALSQATGIDWSLVDLYMGDERLVLPDDAEANQREVRATLADPRKVNFVPMPTELGEVLCVEKYRGVIRALLEGSGIDVIHLGMGADGHVASLFPTSPALLANDDEVVLASIDLTGRNPLPRITVSFQVIAASRLALVTVSGAEKADVVRRLQGGENFPAGRIEAEFLVDHSAAGA